MSENRKCVQVIYNAEPGEVIDNFMSFLLQKFESNKTESIIGYHNHRKITIEERDEDV